MVRLHGLRCGLVALALAAGCSGGGSSPPDEPDATPTTVGSDAESAQTPAAPTPSPTSSAGETSATPRVAPDDGRPAVAMAAVRHLAGRIGPRHGTSAAYREAARWVAEELRGHGWQVRRQPFPTPAGVSWGVPVEGGRSVNLVATLGERGPGQPWLAVGAHLDTVPQAPGAEDNASGVGALLAVAEALADRRARLPVVLVAFGSEEPRGPSDGDHHYGSRAYVDALAPAERRTLGGMVSLDRVGVGDAVPVGSPGAAHGRVGRQLLTAARRDGVPTTEETGERSSDHWSFARQGLPAARLGSTPYAAYHSADDVPAVVNQAQLARTIRLVLAWLHG